jgi:GNAT superfamily N-acetyltransferase
MSAPDLRDYADGDAAALARLMTELGYPTSAEQMSERMTRIKSRSDFATFVADDDGEVVGMIGVCVRPSYEHNLSNGQITALVVARQARGRGIGRLLVSKAQAWLAGEGARRIIVNSGTARADAHAFYIRLGYGETGRRFVKQLYADG